MPCGDGVKEFFMVREVGGKQEGCVSYLLFDHRVLSLLRRFGNTIQILD